MHILGSIDIFVAFMPIIFTFCATHRTLEGEKMLVVEIIVLVVA